MKASPLDNLSFGRYNVMDVMHYFTGLVRFHIRPEREADARHPSGVLSKAEN